MSPIGSCTLQLKRQNHFQTAPLWIKGKERHGERKPRQNKLTANVSWRGAKGKNRSNLSVLTDGDRTCKLMARGTGGTAWGSRGATQVMRCTESSRWEMSGGRKREQCAVMGSFVWGRSVESLKKAGWGAEGGEFDLGCDNDKRPGEMGYGDHSNTCPALHELRSTQTRCGRRECSVPAQEGGDCSTATATSPFVV